MSMTLYTVEDEGVAPAAAASIIKSLRTSVNTFCRVLASYVTIYQIGKT